MHRMESRQLPIVLLGPLNEIYMEAVSVSRRIMEVMAFVAITPLGVRVRVPDDRWNLIIELKHPVMRGREKDVRRALERPEEIRRSKTDPDVLLFYRAVRSGRWTCAVVRRVTAEDGFLITAYPTDAIKEGEPV